MNKTTKKTVKALNDTEIKGLVETAKPTTTKATAGMNQKMAQKILNANEVAVGRNAILQPIFVIKDKQMRFVSLTQGKSNFSSTLLMFGCLNGGGSIPPGWGVSANQQGKMQLKFSISDDEWQNLRKLNGDAINEAKIRKDEWWQGKNKITDAQIEDNYYPIVPNEKNPKKDKETGDVKAGEFWPVQFKCTIPLDDKEQLKGCVIVDQDDMPVSYHDISGRQYEKCLVEVKRVFFMGKYSWGFGPKTLKYIKLKAPTEGEYVGKPDSLDSDEAILSLMGVQDDHLGSGDEPPTKKQKIND